jgi:hypothetical protein
MYMYVFIHICPAPPELELLIKLLSRDCAPPPTRLAKTQKKERKKKIKN